MVTKPLAFGLALCTAISVAVTAYCFLEYQLPHAQYTKVLSELKLAGVNDKEVIQRIQWDILGVQTTWKPLFGLALSQNVLLLALTIWSISKKRTGEERINTEQLKSP